MAASLSDSATVSRMGRVYDFIHDHLHEDLSMARLAEVAIQSPWHFQRVFKEYSGETPAQFVRRLRVERAANLLMMQKNLSVANVATACGYGSAELLARHFHSRFLVSPSAWRNAPQPERFRMIRQAQSKHGEVVGTSEQGSSSFDEYPWVSPLQGELSELRLERRAEVKTIYTRHYQGYDHRTYDAFRRLRDWAEPRGLVTPKARWIGVGLDTPWITDPTKCRFLASLSVESLPDIGEGIGTRSIAAGLYAVVNYRGPWTGLSVVYHHMHQTLLPKAGVEAVDDYSYTEFVSATGAASIDCAVSLPVQSL